MVTLPQDHPWHDRRSNHDKQGNGKVFHCGEGGDGKYLNLAGSDALSYQKVLEKVLHSKGRHKSFDGEEIQVTKKTV